MKINNIKHVENSHCLGVVLTKISKRVMIEPQNEIWSVWARAASMTTRNHFFEKCVPSAPGNNWHQRTSPGRISTHSWTPTFTDGKYKPSYNLLFGRSKVEWGHYPGVRVWLPISRVSGLYQHQATSSYPCLTHPEEGWAYGIYGALIRTVEVHCNFGESGAEPRTLSGLPWQTWILPALAYPL